MRVRTLLQGLLPLSLHSKQISVEETGMALKEGPPATGAGLLGNVEQGGELGNIGNILVHVI